ncbi:MAG TPA: VWA domain-containing protein [Ohtaekwangia sp.]|nr:VWA domain-containing protein [Ohtaekwangia sp.]
MLWYREIGLTEILLATVFFVFYILYIVKVVKIGKRLNTSYSNVFIKVIFRTLYFALFMIALLGPSFGGSKKEVKSVGKDIMICVDLSKSMDAFDIQPSRIEKIKFEMKRIVDAFSADRIGVIIFSSEAFVQCPLTYDQNALNLFIETLHSGLVPNTGTDFGPPLKLALKKLQDEETTGPATQSKSKVIVLISDGEDFGEKTEEISREIEEQDIKLFTLGVGTEQGGNIYAGSGLKKDRSGNIVTTRLNSESLRTLARRTEGQYFEINETKNDVSRLINTIGNIEGELRGTRFVDVTANKYFYFLLAAAVLFMLDMLINVPTIRI